MQLYWIPILTACLSLFTASARGMRNSPSVSRALIAVTIFGSTALVVAYKGENSDWQTYRMFVEKCDEIRCTYFEPGYDLLTYVSGATWGFASIKLALITCFICSVAIAIRGTGRPLVMVLAVTSISIATLPLMLGAVRQALTLPLLLAAAFMLQSRRNGWAFFALAVAGSLHYSAIVAGVWYWILWCLIGRRPHPTDVAKSFCRIGVVVVITYLVLLSLSNSTLGDTIGLIARLGETDAGTDFITTGSLGRDLSILAERIPFAIVALVLYTRHSADLSKTEQVFLLMYVAGSAFFLAFFTFDRNIAGRTMASYRVADVLVIVAVVSSSLRGRLQKKISLPLALVIAMIFVISKSYMTMATVGFFDE